MGFSAENCCNSAAVKPDCGAELCCAYRALGLPPTGAATSTINPAATSKRMVPHPSQRLITIDTRRQLSHEQRAGTPGRLLGLEREGIDGSGTPQKYPFRGAMMGRYG